MSASLVASQQKVAARIEKLVREKRLSEDQLLHLLYIFSREEKVKITRSQNCRLLRLERYGEDTIKKVTQFLDVVETIDPATTAKKEKVPAEPMSKRKSITQPVPSPQKRAILRVAKRLAPERLPAVRAPAAHSAALSSLTDETAFSDVSALNEWLVQQTKRGKQAKKIDPAICCPETSSTVMSLSDRQIPVKKKRKKTAKKRNSQRVKEEEEEEVELVIPEEASIPIAEEDEVVLVGEEDQAIEELGDDEEADEEDEEDDGDENADEDGADEPDEEQSPAHSVADSESDGDSS